MTAMFWQAPAANDADGLTPLMRASARGDATSVAQLLARPAPP
jgi:ankyrin repeat protein